MLHYQTNMHVSLVLKTTSGKHLITYFRKKKQDYPEKTHNICERIDWFFICNCLHTLHCCEKSISDVDDDCSHNGILKTFIKTQCNPNSCDLLSISLSFPLSCSKTSDCQDKRDNCGYLQSMDYCRIMTWYMDKNCRKTCGLCSNGKFYF